MKRFVILFLLAIFTSTSNTSNAAVTIKFADDVVTLAVLEEDGSGIVYVAKATDPSQLIRVGFFKNRELDHYVESLSVEKDQGETIKLEEVSPSTWLVPRREWVEFRETWESIRKVGLVEPVDFPKVRLEGANILPLLMVEEVKDGRLTLRHADATKSYREHHSVSEFAYPPPEGKAFKLGTLRGLLIPVVVEGGKEYALIPVEKGK